MRVAHAVAVGLSAFLAAAGLAPAQVRIAQWNITNWSSTSVPSRGAAFQTAIYGIAPNGQQMAPDVMILQEIVQGGTPPSYPIAPANTTTGQTNVNAFVTMLNSAANSPGDWAAAPYVPNQGDTGNALVYRTSKVAYLDVTTLGCGFSNAPCGSGGATIDVGSGGTQSPRDNQRWRIRLIGYGAGVGSELYLYAGHLKASDGSSEQARKMPEAQRIRADAAALPAGANFVFGGDLNVQTATRNYYQVLVGAGTGQFLDPIISPGTWNNNPAFANIHTQEPATQMDDRHDQLLISGTLRDGQGLSYLPAVPTGNINIPFRVYSTAMPYDSNQWSDPNHSYRCWGNDGNHSGGPINAATTNTQVGQVIADALVTSVAGNGHLGVYLDVEVPAKLGAPTGTIDLGTVELGSSTTDTLSISNTADLARYSKDGTGWGIDALSYSMSFSGSGFSIPAGTGPFERTATSGAPANAHIVELDTSAPGTRTATLTITSDDPDAPSRILTFTAFVSNANSGACCSIAGACTLTGSNSCNGMYQGNMTLCQPNPCPQPTGACCTAGGSCTATTQPACAAAYQGNGTSCSPNLCPSPTGACCTGAACTVTQQNACAGAFQGSATVCGTPGNPTTCCPANYNGNSGVSVDDIFGFLGGWFSAVPRADFNNNGSIDVQDIFDFLAGWFAGC